jgi:spore maturation protein CgeB
LLIEAAQRSPELKTVVAGPMYPRELTWPDNVERIEHLAPASHRHFYNSQRFTLNLTRADMRRAGYSPSVRIFEAAACGTPIISDYWPGLEEFFELEKEILTASSSEQMLAYLHDIPEKDRHALGERARLRVLANHTSEQRALELESYMAEVMQATTTAQLDSQPAGAIA